MSGKKGSKIIREECKKFKEYYIKYFPELSEEECELEAKKFKRSINYLCIEFYEAKYPDLSHEEHLNMLQEVKNNIKYNNPNHIEYYNKNFPDLTQDERDKMFRDYKDSVNFNNISYYRRKYPDLTDEERMKIWDKNRKEWLSHMPDITGENNPAHRSKVDEQTRKERSPFSKEFYKKRGIDVSERDNLYKNMERSYNTTLEYYINKGMTEDEAKLALHNRQKTFTIEKCIEKYGEVEGIKKYNERQKQWYSSLRKNFIENGDGRSIQSSFALNIITKICDNLNIAIPEKEKYIYSKTDNKSYAYDFCYNKKIIEFNGDYWHCNPDFFPPEYYNRVMQKTAQDIWEKDKRKRECAEKYGYTVLTIWENDYNKNPENIIKTCIDFIKS